MLTDIFADRYAKRQLWVSYSETEAKLTTQCFRLVSEQLMPYWTNGKTSDAAKHRWQSLHDRLSMELGLEELAPRYYSYQTMVMGKPHTQSGTWSIDKVCKDFVCAKYSAAMSPDRFLKERVSFIELAFRICEEELTTSEANLPARILAAELQEKLVRPGVLRVPGIAGKPGDALRRSEERARAAFREHVQELNERFRRAGTQLNYHNGFIQVAADELVEKELERPFWTLVAAPIWKNVDLDMKEALDRRDANDKDPAFYAARSLESAIKIISDQKGWTHGGEKGAHNYIDNLGSTKNGAFLRKRECESLKHFFTEVRNPFSHGAGSNEMPELTLEETSFAIETCMSWIKCLVGRFQRSL